MESNRIHRAGQKIRIEGQLGISDFHRLLATIHDAIENKGFDSLILDFSNCTSAFAGPMLALCAQVIKLKNLGVAVSLTLPINEKLSKLFLNTNWAFLIAPERFAPSGFKGYTHIPATTFNNPDDQQNAVNIIVNAMLGAIQDVSRNDFAAFEWSINEITDNVLTHSDSIIGGLIQVSTFQKNKKVVEFVVADAGVGIPKTLKDGHPEISSDTEALDRAIREGVTRDKSIGQGNGLFGSFQICSHSKGYFSVDSGYAKLIYNENKGLHVSSESVPYPGTLIVAAIDFSRPRLLEEVLKFGGKPFTPIDFIETHYEDKRDSRINFIMIEESRSFGSRPAGSPVRTKLQNLIKICNSKRVCIDFKDIPLISSSFADEVFGKLFIEMGPMSFMNRFEFRNVTSTVQQLIDRAISQRNITGI